MYCVIQKRVTFSCQQQRTESLPPVLNLGHAPASKHVMEKQKGTALLGAAEAVFLALPSSSLDALMVGQNKSLFPSTSPTRGRVWVDRTLLLVSSPCTQAEGELTATCECPQCTFLESRKRYAFGI